MQRVAGGWQHRWRRRALSVAVAGNWLGSGGQEDGVLHMLMFPARGSDKEAACSLHFQRHCGFVGARTIYTAVFLTPKPNGTLIIM